MNYDNQKDVLEYTIKAFETFKNYLQECEKPSVIKLDEDVPTHLLLTLSFTFREKEVWYPDIKLVDPHYGYSGFENVIDYFSFQLNYEDYIHKNDASCIDLNKVIKWLDERLEFLKDLRFFDEDTTGYYYKSLCEMRPSNWEVIKAKSQVYKKNLRVYKLKRLNNSVDLLN